MTTDAKSTIDVTARVGAFELSVAAEPSAPVTGIFGPSGCGKTTLLNCISGLIKPQTGRIQVNNRTLFDAERGINLPPRERRIGYVFQDSLLFEHMTVRRNLEYARHSRSGPTLRQVCDVLELGDLLDRSARDLSGGQKRRVAIGRAVLSAPDLILLDEPLTGLDRRLAGKTLSFIKRTLAAFNIAAIYVSHSIGDIIYLCQQVWVINQGRVQSIGSPADVLASVALTDPAPRIKNIFDLPIKRVDAESDLIECDLYGQPLVVSASVTPDATRATLLLSSRDFILAKGRPELLSARNVIEARVAEARTRPGHCMVLLDVGAETPWILHITQQAAEQLVVKPNASVHLIVKASSIACVDAR